MKNTSKKKTSDGRPKDTRKGKKAEVSIRENGGRRKVIVTLDECGRISEDDFSALALYRPPRGEVCSKDERHGHIDIEAEVNRYRDLPTRSEKEMMDRYEALRGDYDRLYSELMHIKKTLAFMQEQEWKLKEIIKKLVNLEPEKSKEGEMRRVLMEMEE